MKRLLLISPLAPSSLMGGDFFFRMPNLGLLKLAALTPDTWDVQIVDEKVEKLDQSLTPDLVGITTMTPTSHRAYAIARHFRARGIPVVMGGMHVSQLPHEALQHCSSVVIGEAEELWPRVLADFERQALQPIYRHENGWPTLQALPLPNWDRYRTKGYLPVHFVETTRGCPVDCEFCSVTTAFGGKYRSRPHAEVLAELRSLRPFDGWFTLKNCLFFVDDNIVSNRAYAREFLTQLAEFKFRWFGQASMNIARDPEILKLCQKSGCMGLFIGFESLSPATLLEMGKRVNHPDQYLETIQRIHDFGIGIDASFVFGFDSDDDGVFERTLDFALRAKIEAAYFSILTPYPGTRLHARLKADGRILTEDWSLYDGSRVVYQPKNFSPEKLREGFLLAWKEFYRVPAIFRRLWGTTAQKNFFYPMNFGFAQSVRKLAQTQRPLAPALQTEPALT